MCVCMYVCMYVCKGRGGQTLSCLLVHLVRVTGSSFQREPAPGFDINTRPVSLMRHRFWIRLFVPNWLTLAKEILARA